jgi:hypothetical protein
MGIERWKEIGCFVLFAFTVSCDYPLEKKYIAPVTPPPSQINVAVNITAPDFKSPYYLDFPTTFTLDLSGINYPVKEYSVTINGSSLVTTFANNTLQFVINPAQYSKGTYPVQVKIKADTQSKSLADQVGAEYYLIEKDFLVIVDPDLPDLSTPLTYQIKNGYLQLLWNLKSSHNYNYRLSIYKDFGPYPATLVEQKNFVGPGQMVFVDSGYVGGASKYTLSISNYAGSGNLPNATVRVGTPFVLQSDQAHANTLAWNPVFADANLTLIGPNQSMTIPYSNGKINLDTLFLGDQKTFRIITSRNLHPLHAFDSSFTLTSTPTFAPFDGIAILQGQSKLLVYSSQATDVFRYNLTDFTKEDNLRAHGYSGYSSGNTMQLCSSADGKKMVFSHGGFPVIADPLNLSSYSLYLANVPPITNSGSMINVFPVALSNLSNTPLQGVSFIYNGSPRGAILDMSTNAYPNVTSPGVIWMDSVNQDLPVISDDGQLFCVNSPDQTYGKVYRNVSGVWTLVGKVSAGKKYFRNQSTNELIVIGQKIEVFDVSTNAGATNFYSPVRSFNYAATLGSQTAATVGYDNVSQNIYVETISLGYSTIKTYNVVTFAGTGKSKAYLAPAVPVSPRHLYSGGYHFVTSGYGEKIQP